MATSEKPKKSTAKSNAADVEDAVLVDDPGISNSSENDEPPAIEKPGVSGAEVSDTTAAGQTAQSRNTVWPLIAAGVFSTALGFGAALYLGGDGWPFGKDTSAIDALTVQLKGQDSRLSDLEQKIADLSDQLSEKTDRAALDSLKDQIAVVAGSVDGIEPGINEIKQRLGDIENRPIPKVGATEEAVRAYEQELSAMRQMFEKELARIEAAQSDAIKEGETITALASAAIERAALARIETALDSGSEFSEAVATLKDTGAEIPPPLIVVSETGVPALSQLQNDFPDIARAVLDAAPNDDADSPVVDRTAAFIRSQLGIRSLTPREGGNSDAILSRAEAWLKSGDIEKTLAELQLLPGNPVDELSNWIARAQERQDAINAVSALSDTLNE